MAENTTNREENQECSDGTLSSHLKDPWACYEDDDSACSGDELMVAEDDCCCCCC